jgi:hypothetical protein
MGLTNSWMTVAVLELEVVEATPSFAPRGIDVGCSGEEALVVDILGL